LRLHGDELRGRICAEQSGAGSEQGAAEKIATRDFGIHAKGTVVARVRLCTHFF
jgi:hypothetical protein